MRPEYTPIHFIEFLPWGIGLLAVVFAAAAGAVCLVRKPLYAAILSVGLTALAFAGWAELISVQPTEWDMLPVGLALFLGSTLLGWVAAVKDLAVR
jgi:hypothetical protein